MIEPSGRLDREDANGSGNLLGVEDQVALAGSILTRPTPLIAGPIGIWDTIDYGDT